MALMPNIAPFLNRHSRNGAGNTSMICRKSCLWESCYSPQISLLILSLALLGSTMLRFWAFLAYSGRNFRFRKGCRKILPPVSASLFFSTKGTRYGTPKLKSPARCAMVRYSPNTIPNIPRNPPRNRKAYFRSRNAEANSSLGIASDPSAVSATMITTTRADKIGLHRSLSDDQSSYDPNGISKSSRDPHTSLPYQLKRQF